MEDREQAVNGVPSCASNFLLQDVLRDTWGFKGYITSDSGAVEVITAHFTFISSQLHILACL